MRLNYERKGVVWGAMMASEQKEIKRLVGDQKCWYFKHNWRMGRPGFKGNTAYWPTKVQIKDAELKDSMKKRDAELKEPESKFTEGSVWYTCLMNRCDVLRVDEDGYVDVLFSSRKEAIGSNYLLTGTPKTGSIPFYAPPSQEELDDNGVEIDCIRMVESGDSAYIDGRYYDVTFPVGYQKASVFHGMAYILKKKEEQAEVPKSLIDEIEKEAKPPEGPVNVFESLSYDVINEMFQEIKDANELLATRYREQTNIISGLQGDVKRAKEKAEKDIKWRDERLVLYKTQQKDFQKRLSVLRAKLEDSRSESVSSVSFVYDCDKQTAILNRYRRATEELLTKCPAWVDAMYSLILEKIEREDDQ